MKHVVCGLICSRTAGPRFAAGWAVFYLPLIFILAGCEVFPNAADQGGTGKVPDVFIAAEWNVQALFDEEETGNEYGEYRETAGWTAEKYAARITAISRAVSQMLDTGKSGTSVSVLSSGKNANMVVPGLIGFVELENIHVLKDLARGSLSKYGYYWTAFANIPEASLGIGFLSRFPFKETRTHSITVGKETAPRPVLEVRIEPRGKPLVFLLCHWKSKLGDDKSTEALRRASARVVYRRLREIKETEPKTPVIVMGDLNENHDEFYRANGTVLNALLPDDPGAAALAAWSGTDGEYLVLSGEKPPRALSFPENVSALYSPWEKEINGGSYLYRHEWETIDHFLLSEELFDNSGWEFDGCRVLVHAPFTTANGRPNSYIPRAGRGLSDHLPLLLYLRDLKP